MKNRVTIYVFGSCHYTGRSDSDDAIGNGGYGAVIIVNEQKTEELSAGFSNTTNARMDIMGITESLSRINSPSEITVYLSNGYIIDTLSKGWLENWKRIGYKKKKHADLWKKLDEVLSSNTHVIIYKHSRDCNNHPNFVRAEQLGKKMSVAQNSPADLVNENESTNGLFESAPVSQDPPVDPELFQVEKPIEDAVCVDASCIENPGRMEFRGIELKTGKIVFEMKYEEATNNIGEFLAIVYALAKYKKEGKVLKVVYSDSMNAISWVAQKKCKTKLEPNQKNALVFEHIQRAVSWLKTNEYDTKVLKWNTAAWGEIPADYGRK